MCKRERSLQQRAIHNQEAALNTTGSYSCAGGNAQYNKPGAIHIQWAVLAAGENAQYSSTLSIFVREHMCMGESSLRWRAIQIQGALVQA